MDGSAFRVLGLLAAGLSLASVACAQTPAPPPGFANAEALLDALETADKDLVSLTADVKWERTFEVQGDKQVRLGKLYYIVKPPEKPGTPPDRRFAIRFTYLQHGASTPPEDRTYIFDGEWFMDKNATDKFYQKRQVVPPGERFDPLRIGQGPLTIPIGQKKADIVERYSVELLAPSAGLDAAKDATEEEKRDAATARADVEGCWQLRLTPRPNFAEQEDYSEIRLWYKKNRNGDLLPRMARTVNKSSGDISAVLLINDEAQYAGRPENPKAKVPAEAVDTTSPPGWDGRTDSWRGHEGANAGDK